jgi:hypothetical protein
MALQKSFAELSRRSTPLARRWIVPIGPRSAEQYAYDLIGGILGAEVRHVDGDAPGHFDAEIVYGDGRVAALEVTAPPSHEELSRLARERREGKLPLQTGVREWRPNLELLPAWVSERLNQDWAQPNVEKLVRSGLSERHLALHLYDTDGLGLRIEIMDAESPPCEEPRVPEGLTDLWIFGMNERVVRWSRNAGWSLHQAPPLTKEDKARLRALSRRASR